MSFIASARLSSSGRLANRFLNLKPGI